jgi:hypothetical protein
MGEVIDPVASSPKMTTMEGKMKNWILVADVFTFECTDDELIERIKHLIEQKLSFRVDRI